MQSSRKLGALWALGVGGAILLAGCGSAATTTTSSTPAASSSTSSSASSSAASSSSNSAATATKTANVTAVTLPYSNSIFAKVGDAAANDAATGKPAARFDSGGYAMDAATAPSGSLKVAVNGENVSFQFPSTDTSAKNAITLTDGQKSPDITVTSGKYSTLYLLGAAGNGPAGLTVTLKYSDGSATAPAVITDWCSKTGQSADAVQAWMPSDRIGPDGKSTGPACGLWVSSVKLDNTKTLTGLSFAALAAAADVTGSTPDKPQDKSAAASIVAAALAQ